MCFFFPPIQGFTRLETGAGGRGVWFHKNFIRSKPELITRIKRVPVKQATPPKSSDEELSSNPTMDYTNYNLNEKVAKAIAASNDFVFPTDGMLSKSKSKRHSLPLRKRSPSAGEGEGSKPPAPAANSAARNAAGMMGALQGQTPLQRLYASQEVAVPSQFAGSQSSRFPPFILTSYQPAGGAMAGHPDFPQGYAPSAFMNGPTYVTPSASNPSQLEDVIVASQLAALGRPPDAIAAASASRPMFPNDASASRPMLPNDAALMARAMVMESERRRQHYAIMQAQAQAAHVAQAHAAHAAQAQAHAAHAQAQTMNMGMPTASNMGSDSDTDILAAIQQRKQFLSRLEAEFKAKIMDKRDAARGVGGM